MAAQVDPVLITAKELSVHFGEQVILDETSLTIHDNDRIGLVGRNGAGKSTFLKIVTGLFSPDSGNVEKRKNLEIGFLSQEFTLDETKTVYENVFSGAGKIVSLLDQYEKLPFESEKRMELEEKITALNGWNIENLISTLLNSLNAPEKDKTVALLSGGEKRRVALCRALISHPDLLILDEPTNHLDTDSIEWIENFLSNYKGACIFVTHDRYFLDRIANRIVELHNGKFYSHQGNYTEFLLNKAEREAIAEAEEKKRQNFLRRELEWVRRGPKARTSKSKSRLDKFHEVASQESMDYDVDVEMLIPPPGRLGNSVLDVVHLEKSLGGKKLFSELNFQFKAGERLGIVGKNGTGKTTLLRCLLNEMEIDNGKIEVGDNTEFNYIDQSRLTLNDEDTVVEAVGEGNNFIKFGNQQLTVWSYLKRFLFTDDRINTLVGRLSGGEKSRLTLANILKKGGNFLILDEPTNDLDLPTLRVLEETLINFKGCVIVVSHDRYFLNRVCTSILAFEGDGKTYLSDGNYDYYLQKRKERQKPEEKSVKPEKDKAGKVKTQKKKLKWKEEKELETIEEDIMNAEAEVERIETMFSASDFYEKHSDKINELNEELAQAKEKVQTLYSRWEELEEMKNNLD